MSDVDLPVRSALDALVPQPRRSPDWGDVLRRTEPRLWRRPLVLALAGALIVLGTAAGVTAALGGFDSWLSGKPGKPAPAAEQQRFEAANGRAWAAFPRDTKLRELIRTTVEGKTYVLFGFRSGHTLCLKLRAISLGHSTDPACTPESTVAHSTSPIVVVNSDFGFQDRRARESAEFSFGIAADGVSQVEVRAVDGLHKAVIGGNAYLWVENEPNTGNRVLALTAHTANGSRMTISLGTTFGDLFPLGRSGRRPRGPGRVEAPIAHPTIGWAARGEKRGFSRDRLDLNSYARTHFVTPTARFVKPDPLGDTVVGLDGTHRLFVVQGRGAAGGSLSNRALNVITSGGGGVQSATVAGAAADGIVRLTIFDADGQRFAVPLRDNLFATRVAETQFPLRRARTRCRSRDTSIRPWPAGLAPRTSHDPARNRTERRDCDREDRRRRSEHSLLAHRVQHRRSTHWLLRAASDRTVGRCRPRATSGTRSVRHRAYATAHRDRRAPLPGRPRRAAHADGPALRRGDSTRISEDRASARFRGRLHRRASRQTATGIRVPRQALTARTYADAMR